MTQLEYPFMLNVSKYILATDLINFRCINKKCTLTENSFINFIPLCFDVYEYFLHFIKSPVYKTPEDVIKLFPNIQTLYISIIVDNPYFVNKYNFDDIINRIFKFWPCLEGFKLKIKLIAKAYSKIEFNEFEPDIKEIINTDTIMNLDTIPSYIINNFHLGYENIITIEYLTNQQFNDCIYPLFNDGLNRIRKQLYKEFYLKIITLNSKNEYWYDNNNNLCSVINECGERITINTYDPSFETKYFNNLIKFFNDKYIHYNKYPNKICSDNKFIILNGSIDDFKISCKCLSLPNVEEINTGTVLYTKIIKAPKLKKIGHKCITCYINLNGIEHYDDSCFNVNLKPVFK